MSHDAGSVPLPLGWEYPDSDWAASLDAELQRELPPGHPLYGCRVEVFAAREGDDDTLLRHLDDPGRFTVVHLTWLGREEINAQHPWVEFDGTLAEFLDREHRIVAGLGLDTEPGAGR
jgi:hypothetical protein